jgi:hypothetical protein
MFYEELDFLKFDHAALVKDLKEQIMPLGNQVIQGEDYETPAFHGFGGWSVTSQSGDWKDGWDVFHDNENDGRLDIFSQRNGPNFEALKFFGINHSMECNVPTKAYVGEFARLLAHLESLKMYPRRARITCLKAGSKSMVHSDAGFGDYMARLHIPLITNPKCVYICDGVHLHKEAGKAYAVWVNRYHQIRNDSDQDRYHLIMDFYDVGKNTKTFHYEGDITQLEDLAVRMRTGIDQAVISPELLEKFEAVRQQFVTKGKPNAK